MKKKESEYKKYYTFKHNCSQQDDENNVWINPKPVSTSHISDEDFDRVKSEILNRI